MNYSINREAIIFLDTDSENGYHTVSYDFESGDLIAVRPPEYHLLKFVYDQQKATELAIKDFVGETMLAAELKEMMDKLLEKGILRVNE